MVAKKKAKKQAQKKSKRTAASKNMKMAKTARQKAAQQNRAAKRKTPKRTPANKKAAKGKASAKTKPVNKRAVVAKTVSEFETPIRPKSQGVHTVAASYRGRGSTSGMQSGDLQGLSNREQADSQSVDELLDEGNAFEADVVTGVEEAGDDEMREVHTHEVPEDDVPEEYLDKDE
jgi:hypothetical protein